MAAVDRFDEKVKALARAQQMIRVQARAKPGTDACSEGTRLCLLLEEIEMDLERANRDAQIARNGGLRVVRQ
jgi:hypothetical protein